MSLSHGNFLVGFESPCPQVRGPRSVSSAPGRRGPGPGKAATDRGAVACPPEGQADGVAGAAWPQRSLNGLTADPGIKFKAAAVDVVKEMAGKRQGDVLFSRLLFSCFFGCILLISVLN